MKVIKRINNNAVLCVDGAGNQVVALGKGVCHTPVGQELDLDLVDHTFYDVDPRYIDLMRDLPADCLRLSAHVADAARSLLPYELSPNIDIALADHISFAIKRLREGLMVQAPLAYDIRQNYPLEYKIAEYALRRVKAELGVELPRSETAGIAMCLINGAYDAAGTAQEPNKDELLENIAVLVEGMMGVTVDREGFGYARFATHVRYLLSRAETGESIATENSGLYPALAEASPETAACADAISTLIRKTYGRSITEEERLYLILHINRICARSQT